MEWESYTELLWKVFKIDWKETWYTKLLFHPCDTPDTSLFKGGQRFAVFTVCVCVTFCSDTLNLMKFLPLRWSFFGGLWACSSLFPSGHSVCVHIWASGREKKKKALFFYLFYICMFVQSWRPGVCVCAVWWRNQTDTKNSCLNVCAFVCGVLWSPQWAFISSSLYFPLMLTGNFWLWRVSVCLHFKTLHFFLLVSHCRLLSPHIFNTVCKCNLHQSGPLFYLVWYDQ